MQKDITTKETIKAITYDIATYILNLKMSQEFEFVDKELKFIEKREADIVVLCHIEGIESILHLEIQNSNDKEMSLRMLRYYLDIKRRYPKTPIYQYVVYIGKPKLAMHDFVKDQQIAYSYNLIDMHTIDCEALIKLDTPDALVLSILCDFKEREALDVLTFILKRLDSLLKEDEYNFKKYSLILETLSQNRELKETLKEAEEMLREIKLENLPSYEIGLERGLEQGLSQGAVETAITMIREFNLSVEEVAKRLKLPLDELVKYMSKG
jgi:predicted transposase YdaD